MGMAQCEREPGFGAENRKAVGGALAGLERERGPKAVWGGGLFGEVGEAGGSRDGRGKASPPVTSL